MMKTIIDLLHESSVSISDIILNIVLIVFFIGATISLYKLHRANSKYENFNLVWLLVNRHGYPDGAKCIEMGTWVLMSWGFIVHILNKTLPDWYLVSYVGAFIARGGLGAYLRSQGGDKIEKPPHNAPKEVGP